MRDGITLAATVRLPPGKTLADGPFPTVIEDSSNIIMKLPDETVVYPGHNYGNIPTDTIGRQKQTNPYLQCNSLKEFLVERMGL